MPLRRGGGSDTDTDEVLLRRVGRGDADALTALYRRHADGLFWFLLRLAADRMLAEEILQDTLLAVWRGADSFAGRAKVRTWLYGIARRQAHNRLRVARPVEAALDDVAEPVTTEPGPEELALAGLERERVLAAVDRLSLVHREVMVLMFVAECHTRRSPQWSACRWARSRAACTTQGVRWSGHSPKRKCRRRSHECPPW